MAVSNLKDVGFACIEVLRRSQFAVKLQEEVEPKDGDTTDVPKRGRGRPSAKGKAKAKAKGKAKGEVKGKAESLSRAKSTTCLGDNGNTKDVPEPEAPMDERPDESEAVEPKMEERANNEAPEKLPADVEAKAAETKGDQKPEAKQEAKDARKRKEQMIEDKSGGSDVIDPARKRKRTGKKDDSSKKKQDPSKPSEAPGAPKEVAEAKVGEPVPEAPKRKLDKTQVQTFARRTMPSTELGRLKWLALRETFNREIRPTLKHYSAHEDP